MSESGRSQGLFASVRQLLGTVLEFTQVRIALISNEIEQEKLRLFAGLLWAGLGLILLGLSAILLTTLAIVLLWENYRLETLGGLAMIFMVVGGGFLLIARMRLRKAGGLFRSSVEELARDHAAITTGKSNA